MAASTLPYGLRKRVELARAIAMVPRVLILDEPTAGMRAAERIDTAALIARLNLELGLALVLVEHDVPLVRGIVDRIVVLNTATVLMEGAPDEVLADERVVASYLGAAMPRA